MKILVVDVGGSHVKVLASGQQRARKVVSGPSMTAEQMVMAVREIAAAWKYDAVSIGYPGAVRANRPVAEPHNLGPGWIGFDFERAFGCPVKVINDAAMQALGSYQGGHMLFLGLGTGLGSALVVDRVVVPLELAHLPYKKGKTYEHYVGAKGLKRLGKKKWRTVVADVCELLRTGMQAEDVVIGGGDARLLKVLPAGMRLGNNANAFMGGYRMWQDRDDDQEPGAGARRRSDKRATRSAKAKARGKAGG